MSTFSRYLSTISLVVAAFLWGSSFVALKIAFRHYDPMVVIFARMAIASLCFAFFIRRLTKGVVLKRRDIKYILIMSLCEPCMYFVFEAKAMVYTTASQAGMITSMFPLLVAVGAGFLLKERVSRKTMIGFGISIAGACWLSLSSETTESAPNPLLGNALEFIAMIFATGYAITLKRLTSDYPPFLLAGFQAFIGSLFFMLFLFRDSVVFPVSFEPVSTMAVVYLGVFITLGAYSLFNFGVSRIPASQASAFINLIPVFGVFLGWSILGERFTTGQYFASALVFAGVLVSQEKKREALAVEAAN